MNDSETKRSERLPAGQLGARRPIGPWPRFRRWARRVDLIAKFEFFLMLMAVVMGVITYSALAPEAPQQDALAARPSLTLLLTLTLLPILGLAALIARRVIMLWVERRKNSAGSRLHGRVIILFSLVAIVPTLLVAIFSSLLFEFGLRVWFSDRVRTVLDSAATVAEAYVAEHRKFLGEEIRTFADDLNRGAAIYEQDSAALQDFLANQLVFRDLSEAIVFDSSMRVLARASNNVSIGTDGVARGDFERALAGDVVIITGPGAERDRVRAVIKLNKFFDAYLYVSRLVDAKVMGHFYETQRAVSEYRQLESERSTTQLRFNIVLVLVSLAILLAAIVVGFWFATRLVRPLSHIVNASERVRKGDLTARVPMRGAIDEIGVLARAFNRMTSQLQNQTNELVSANLQLDQRSRFTEAVLGGVSAGVLGLDADGRINLPNRSACALLKMTADEMAHMPLEQLAPEMAALMDVARDDPEGHAEGQVNLEQGGQWRNLLVQVRAERAQGKLIGYVVTFDDITSQLADQRRAAWADVARRIAHEIKNPLTPIQLSAERLRRKYAREVISDPAVFEQCTDTIIRQVNDLRRMVDEFSSFARMPAPIFHAEDFIDVVRHAAFLLEVSYPDIQFHFAAPEDTVELVCDRRLIAQAVTNLVKNAAESIEQRKFDNGDTAPRGKIDIAITADAKQVCIKIDDNGRGLPPEIRERLFEPYVTTRAKGTGLGLAIVKKIIEDHGGKLVLEDRVDGGARAVIHFDRQQLAERMNDASADDALGTAAE